MTPSTTTAAELRDARADEAESAVIACLLGDPSALAAADGLAPGHFRQAAHAAVWAAALEVAARGRPPESLAIWAAVRAAGEHAEVTAAAGRILVDLYEGGPTMAYMGSYAREVRAMAAARAFVRACGEAAEAVGACAGADEAAAAMAAAHGPIAAAAEEALGATSGLGARPLGALVDGVLSDLDARMTGRVEDRAVPLGWPDLDRLVPGLRPGDLCVLAARPSVGKTAFACQVAARACARGLHVAFASLEQSAPALARRMLAQESRVPARALLTGRNPDGSRLDGAQVQAAAAARARMARWSLRIRDGAAQPVSAIRAAVRRDPACDLLIVDHLHLVAPEPGSGRAESRYREVSAISHALKAAAKDLGAPVLALAQLSRDAHDPSRPPSLRHLRDSGTIEEDADVVILLHRPGYYDPAARGLPGPAEVAVAKHRDGEVGSATLTWRPEVVSFESSVRDCDAAPDAPAGRGPAGEGW